MHNTNAASATQWIPLGCPDSTHCTNLNILSRHSHCIRVFTHPNDFFWIVPEHKYEGIYSHDYNNLNQAALIVLISQVTHYLSQSAKFWYFVASASLMKEKLLGIRRTMWFCWTLGDRWPYKMKLNTWLEYCLYLGLYRLYILSPMHLETEMAISQFNEQQLLVQNFVAAKCKTRKIEKLTVSRRVRKCLWYTSYSPFTIVVTC